jgi:hypothetical protein
MTALLTETTRDLTTRLGEELRLREGEKLRRRVLRNLVRSADALAGITLSAWSWVRETLEGEGFEGRELAGYCQVLLDGIDGTLAGYERLLALTNESGLPPEAAGLPDLEAMLPALREARPQVAGVLGLATRAPRPVEEAMLAGSQAALDRGEFVTVDDDYLARLQADGDF